VNHAARPKSMHPDPRLFADHTRQRMRDRKLERADIFESEKGQAAEDPDATHPPAREVVTQNYDLVVSSLIEQIKTGDIVLRPSFQRGYVWPNGLASRLIESIILNVPIPPCYLSQNEEFELDVVDGQQRLQSIFRYIDNQFSLSSLDIANELNGLRFHQLPSRIQRQIKSHTVRCVMITNKSHPDVKFDIFERLNSNTASLNSQELRNCIYRGEFNDRLKEIANRDNWLTILGRKSSDKRMRGEETVLRHFAFKELGLEKYRTPLKNWLNDAAEEGSKLTSREIDNFDAQWENMLTVSTIWFPPNECFRRAQSKSINRALFDLVGLTASKISPENAIESRTKFRSTYYILLEDAEFEDLISRSVDHKKRTERRFEIWSENYSWLGI
ncbi:DUF262 domain-containing protein, partial [Marinovum sp. PR37]